MRDLNLVPRISFRASILFSLAALSTFLLAVSGPVHSEIRGEGDPELQSPGKLAEFRAYYRAHDRVRLGPERRLKNGVSWRLLFDAATGLAVPRVTWMPDRNSTNRANRLFESIHGLSLIEYAEEAEQWPKPRKLPPIPLRKREEDWVSSPSPPDRFISQDEIAVTYATSKLVSYVELGSIASQGSYVPPLVRGWTLDLDRDVVFGIGSCPGGKVYPFETSLFRFGDLLDACDEASHSRFVELLAAAAERAATPEAQAKDPYSAYCHSEAGSFGKPERILSLYLTPSGLAVHNESYGSKPARMHCPRERNAFNPLFIPYRELEPFMKPGPLRDELLKLTAGRGGG